MLSVAFNRGFHISDIRRIDRRLDASIAMSIKSSFSPLTYVNRRTFYYEFTVPGRLAHSP